ncbi:hypothetical protein PS15m_005754 [Mucor circinelloides]
MFQEQQSTTQLDPIFTATSALPPPPVLVPALMSGSTSEVDTTAGTSSSLDVSAEAATTSPSSLCVAKKRGARRLLKKSKIRQIRKQGISAIKTCKEIEQNAGLITVRSMYV